MSGLSSSLSFALDETNAQRVATSVLSSDTSVFDECLREDFLITGSRNNYLEVSVYRLATQFAVGDLHHLTCSFAAGRPQQGWFATSLSGATLSAAVAALESLITAMSADRIKTTSALGDIHIQGHEWSALDARPSSVKDAIAAFEFAQRVNEGDDAGTVFTFLKAHVAVLELARARSLAAVYAVCLY